MSAPRYDNPQAFRQALSHRLRPLAKESGMELSALLRQFAYDRLLCRVFGADPERWVLKGATAIHDYFRFSLGAARQVAQDADALRIPVVAFLGASEFSRFHVDLVADLSMTSAAEEFSPLIPVELPGVRNVAYCVYPIADHIADKVCAMFERHPRADGRTEQSTRYRDLVDLVTFAHTATVGASDLRRAIDSEAERRRLTLPDLFEVPSSSGWAAGYARVARDTPGLEERDLESAVLSARRFIDPPLAGTAKGSWDPAAMAWIPRANPQARRPPCI